MGQDQCRLTEPACVQQSHHCRFVGSVCRNLRSYSHRRRWAVLTAIASFLVGPLFQPIASTTCVAAATSVSSAPETCGGVNGINFGEAGGNPDGCTGDWGLGEPLNLNNLCTLSVACNEYVPSLLHPLLLPFHTIYWSENTML